MQIALRQEALPVIPLDRRDPRTGGLHLSTILHKICETLEPDRFGRLDDEWDDLDENPKIWLGSAVDHYLTHVLGRQNEAAIRPDSIMVDGIWMSSDLILLDWEPPRPGIVGDTDEIVVEEFKLSWMSIRLQDQAAEEAIRDRKFRHYLWQLMAYMRAWGTRRGRIRFVAVNNDYKPPTPVYYPFDVLCTERELDDNWLFVVRHAKKFGLL